MPASRKVCGFFGHAALYACTQCMKAFHGSIHQGTKNSGFNRDSWPLRSNSSHRAVIAEIKAAKTVSDHDQLESKYGCRYSVLLELPYFDPTRMCLFDPMHNLYNGTSKHVTKNIWMDGILTSDKVLQNIQYRMDAMHVPPDIGRIPRKIEASFFGFTTEQYKNWVNLYSIPCLHGMLSDDHIECWLRFVLASQILSK